MVEPAAFGALILEAAIGWPNWLYRRIGHPVGFFAQLIGLAEDEWNAPDRSDSFRLDAGVMLVLVLLGGTVLLAWASQWALAALLGGWSWVAVAILAIPGLAQRSLHDHVTPIRRALAAGDVPEARELVGRIVGRDTAELDEAGVARAAIESLSESFCDGIVAPAFWLLIAGLPGLWGYKLLNTADSLIGHKEPRWQAFGWASARADDLANLIPARLSGLLICCAGLGGLRTMLRDARKHASPNAGWPEAAMAGVLGLRLAGPIAYDDVVQQKPWIGDGRAEANVADLTRALGCYRRACLLLWLIAGGCAWLL